MNHLGRILIKNSKTKFHYLGRTFHTNENQLKFFNLKQVMSKNFYNSNSFSFCQKNSIQDNKDFCFSKDSNLSDKPIEETSFKTNDSAIAIETKRKKVAMKDIMEITKFKLCLLNLSVSMSTFVYYSSHLTFLSSGFFALGTVSAAMTTQVLNQIMERIYDKKMRRTQMRPLPKQRMTTKEAYFIAGSLWTMSMGSYIMCAPHSIYFTAGILSLYIFSYTPLKRINNLSMHIGAVVGALPALLGSYAVTGVVNFSLNDPAFLLASYIFCWQYPHFYGILYQNKEDYAKAGFKFISNDESKTHIAYIQLLAACLAMFGIIWKMRERKILNDLTTSAFLGSYIYSLIPAVMFITNPAKYSKLMRVRSYTPFLIILGAFIHASTKRKDQLN